MLFEEGIDQYQPDRYVLFEPVTTPSLRCNSSRPRRCIDIQMGPKKQKQKGENTRPKKKQRGIKGDSAQAEVTTAQSLLKSTPIPRRTRSSHPNPENPNTESSINLDTSIPIEVIDVDAESACVSAFCLQASNLVQKHFKEIACTKSLIEFLYSIS